jgi:phage FluMu gp28-like protein
VLVQSQQCTRSPSGGLSRLLVRDEAKRESCIVSWINSSMRPLLGPGDHLTTVGVDFARSAGGDLTVIAPLVERQDLVKCCPWWVEGACSPYSVVT